MKPPAEVTLSWEDFSKLASGVIAMASAYERHASRGRNVGRAEADPVFNTRMQDFRALSELAKRLARQCHSSS